MVLNYFKIAWRSLKKQPFFTFLNIFGLAIGMAGALLISLYIYDELNFDKMYADTDRIHRINTDIKFGGDEVSVAESSAPMAAMLEKDFPQVELATRFRNQYSMLIRKSGTNENVKEFEGNFVDDTFFKMFGFELLYGDTTTALKEPNTLILTKTAAEKHFKIDEAVGQSVIIDNNETYIVTGVIDDMPKNSFLRNDNIFISMASLEDAKNTQWGSNNYATFIKLIPNANIEDFQESLQSVFKTYVMPWAQKVFPGITLEGFLAAGNYFNISSIPLKDIHLHSQRSSEFSPNSDIQNVYILGLIGLFLILLASVNFMNLSTAHSLKRAKEVGIRKTLGSSKLELIRQFLSESGLITFISLLLAIILAAIALPFFSDLSGRDISIPFSNPFFWLILIFATIILALFSGMYPAFFMSKFAPVEVLKGGGQNSIGGSGIRSSLVVFQFAISVFLIVSTLVVFQQLKFIQNKDLGYSKDRVLIIQDVDAAGNKVQSFKNEVQQLSAVENVSLSSFLPTPSNRSDSSYFQEGKMDQDYAIQMQSWRVDYNYINTLDLEIIAGRNFDKKFSTDSLGIIINETAVAIMGIKPEDALGLRVTHNIEDEELQFYTIIGVVKNFHFESLRENIGGLSLVLGDYTNALAVKINARDYASTIASIEQQWKKMAPGQPFNYYFLEDSFNSTYESEQRLGRIFTTFTILSLLIACLGLFGLAAFSAEKRAKEIGVRKVLGASVGQITYKLSVDFLKLVGIAIIISIPLSWYIMNKWLEDFTYRIDISWGVFALAILMAVTISIITVSFQSIKAAIVNPIKSLKTE
ncbi:ABC transporter permease [Urechidicola croceus]|uniref:Cell division protein FtsX n=1 Tax=Urechidicola croceus TaxID=1850246 RepID=A0A1D8P5N9_9FLAO|nr:ABC transporter permease [Urechidicola croceus]AOW19883.1 cell division protein FtsX [Urechidicola croceus]